MANFWLRFKYWLGWSVFHWITCDNHRGVTALEQRRWSDGTITHYCLKCAAIAEVAMKEINELTKAGR